MSPERTSDLLAAFAVEVSDVADGMEALSSLLAVLVAANSPVDRNRALQEAQALDALVQRCRALGDVAAGVAAGRDLDGLLDVLSLAELADRLRSSSVGPSSLQPDVRPIAGDVLLFD